MKPPVNIDALMEEWIKDAAYDETEPQRAMANIPKLHAKYLRIMTHHNLTVKKLLSEYNSRRKIKFDYISGDLNNPEDLEKYSLEPMTKKVLRSDIPMWLDSDTELNNILLKKVIHEEIVEFCKNVLKELNNRTWQLKSYMDWEKFVGGQ
jgi:Recombination, repair and ssDNA binding protein UvsY